MHGQSLQKLQNAHGKPWPMLHAKQDEEPPHVELETLMPSQAQSAALQHTRKYLSKTGQQAAVQLSCGLLQAVHATGNDLCVLQLQLASPRMILLNNRMICSHVVCLSQSRQQKSLKKHTNSRRQCCMSTGTTNCWDDTNYLPSKVVVIVPMDG